MIIHYHEEIFNVNTISIQKNIFKKRKSICNNFSHCTFTILGYDDTNIFHLDFKYSNFWGIKKKVHLSQAESTMG